MSDWLPTPCIQLFINFETCEDNETEKEHSPSSQGKAAKPIKKASKNSIIPKPGTRTIYYTNIYKVKKYYKIILHKDNKSLF